MAIYKQQDKLPTPQPQPWTQLVVQAAEEVNLGTAYITDDGTSLEVVDKFSKTVILATSSPADIALFYDNLWDVDGTKEIRRLYG